MNCVPICSLIILLKCSFNLSELGKASLSNPKTSPLSETPTIKIPPSVFKYADKVFNTANSTFLSRTFVYKLVLKEDLNSNLELSPFLIIDFILSDELSKCFSDLNNLGLPFINRTINPLIGFPPPLFLYKYPPAETTKAVTPSIIKSCAITPVPISCNAKPNQLSRENSITSHKAPRVKDKANERVIIINGLASSNSCSSRARITVSPIKPRASPATPLSRISHHHKYAKNPLTSPKKRLP